MCTWYVPGNPATSLMQFLTCEERYMKSRAVSAEQVQHWQHVLSHSSQGPRTALFLQNLLGLSNENVKTTISKKRVAVLTSKSLFLQVSTQKGLKTIHTDITKGGHVVQITILGHQLPCPQFYSLVSFLGWFFFFLITWLITATQTLAASLFALMSFYYPAFL